MKRFWSTRGEVKMASIVSLAVLAFAVYEGIQFVPVLFAGQVLIFLSNLRTVPRARLSC